MRPRRRSHARPASGRQDVRTTAHRRRFRTTCRLARARHVMTRMAARLSMSGSRLHHRTARLRRPDRCGAAGSATCPIRCGRSSSRPYSAACRRAPGVARARRLARRRQSRTRCSCGNTASPATRVPAPARRFARHTRSARVAGSATYLSSDVHGCDVTRACVAGARSAWCGEEEADTRACAHFGRQDRRRLGTDECHRVADCDRAVEAHVHERVG